MCQTLGIWIPVCAMVCFWILLHTEYTLKTQREKSWESSFNNFATSYDIYIKFTVHQEMLQNVKGSKKILIVSTHLEIRRQRIFAQGSAADQLRQLHNTFLKLKTKIEKRNGSCSAI